MVQGDRAQAESALTGAITTFDACEMKLYAAAARCALGGFGPSGATLARAGERWMLEASVQDVPAATRMILGWG
jgi:hypothetical protein